MPTLDRPRRLPIAKEGFITGLLGASVVALCYLIVDLVRGVPLLTPSVLAEVVLLHRPNPSLVPQMSYVAMYTAFHIATFVLFGYVLTWIAGRAHANPIARYGVVQLLVAFIVFAIGVLAFMSDGTRGLFPVPLVLVANTLAAVAMGGWLWMQHPSLRRAVRSYPLGGIDKPQDLTISHRT